MKTKIIIILISIIAIAFSGCVEDEVYVGPPSFSSVTIDPSSPGATDDVTVTAVLSDLKGISSATLYYKTTTGESFTSIAMTVGVEKSYSAVLPAHPIGTIILYYIEAENVSKIKALYPANAPTTTSAYTVGAPAIVINEIFSRGVVSNPDWIELYNSSSSTVNIGGYKIYDSGGQSAAKPKMEVPAGTTIASHGYYVIVVDDVSVDNPDGSSFGLSSGGEEVWLESSAGYLIDNVIFPAMPVATTSYGRKPDGSSTWEILTTVTKNAPNSATAAVITGMAINPTSPSASDAVTVSATVTDLQGLTTVKLYYKVGDGTYANITMTAAGNVYSAGIPAQAAASVVSYYIEAVNSVPLTTYSPSTAPTTPSTYTVISPSAITNFAKTPSTPCPADAVTVSATIVDVQGLTSVKLFYKVGSGSYSSVTMTAVGNDYTGVIHAQAGAEVVSYYIEATNVPGLKVYAPADAPTTPEAYTVKGPILMNELQSRGITTEPDWIEIYNSSSAAVDIGGYKIYDSGGQGGTKPKMEFAAGTIIPANGYFVITVDDAAIDYPDGSSFGLSSSGEAIWLENASGTIIDNVNFSPTTVATESYGRRPDGSSNWQILTTITKGLTNGTK